MQLSSEERKALVEELCDALRAFPLHNTHRSVRQMIVHDSIMPIIDRILTTRTHTTADDGSSKQWNPLLRVLLDEFGGLVAGEGAAETVIRILREQRSALEAAAPHHGDDLDAMLDSVHPEALVAARYAIQAVTSDPPDHWEATVRVPVKGHVGFWPHTGTGLTRIAAVADAVARAKGQQP